MIVYDNNQLIEKHDKDALDDYLMKVLGLNVDLSKMDGSLESLAMSENASKMIRKINKVYI